jgi:hypothetical protein
MIGKTSRAVAMKHSRTDVTRGGLHPKLPASEDVTAITNYSSSSPLFFGRRVIDVRSPKRRLLTSALSKKLHSLPSSVRRIISPRGWRVLVATAAEDRLSFSAANDGQ